MYARGEEVLLNREKKKSTRRLTPLGRFIVNIFLLGIFALAGALVGYSVIGDGHPMEVLMPDTWIHLAEVIKNSVSVLW